MADNLTQRYDDDDTNESLPIRLVDIGGVLHAVSILADSAGTLWDTVPVSAASLPLPTGASTEALQTTGNTALAAIQTSVELLDNAVSGNELQVDIVGALPAGTNNIGDVDVLSVIPGTGATNLGKAADSAAGATDTGVAPLAVRDDALSALTPAEGDYAPLRVDATGALWTAISGTVTVGSHAVTNAGTFAVQVDGAALTALQLIDDAVYTGGTGTPSKGIGVLGSDGTNPQFISVNSSGHVNIADGGNAITVDGTVAVSGTVTVDLGVNNDVTVTGSVTANAGTNLNTSALALESGGNLAAAATSLATLDNIVSGSEAQVDIVAALPAGTNNIGDVDVASIAAGDNNIGNVDIVTVPADPFGANADAASATGSISAKLRFIASTGIPITGTVTVGSHAVTNAGTFAVQAAQSGTWTVDLGATDNAVLDAIAASLAGTLTVGSHAVTNAGTFAVQVDGSALTALQLLDDVVYVDDADWTATTSKHTLIGGVYQSAPGTITDGDTGPLRVNANGALHVAIVSGAGSGGTASDDDADFTAGTTSGTPTMGVYESSPSTVTDGDLGIVGITQNRAMRVFVDNTINCAVSNQGIFPVQVDGAALTALQLIDDAVQTEDAAHSTGDKGMFVLAVRSDTAASTSGTDGDYTALITDSSGRLHVNVGNTLTVASHAVTNAGTFAVQAAQSGTWTVDLGATDNAVLDAIAASLAILDDIVSGTEAQVDIVAALPTGDNTVGRVKLTDGTDVADVLDLTNSNPLTVAIVDGDGTQITSFGGGTQYAVDAALGANPTGTLAIGIRDDALSALGPAEGDAIGLRVDANGALWVTVSGTVTVGSHAVTNAGTFAVQAAQSGTWNITDISGTISLPTGASTLAEQQSQTTHLATIASAVQTEDVAHSTGHKGVFALAVRSDTAAATGANGDYVALITDSAGKLHVNVGNLVTVGGTVDIGSGTVVIAGQVTDDAAFSPAVNTVVPVGFFCDESSTDSVDEGDGGAARMTANRQQIVTVRPNANGEGLDTFRSIDIDETEEEVKGTAGKLYGYYFFNAAASTRYLKFYDNTAAGTTVGTTTPKLTFPLPAGAAGHIEFTNGIPFGTGITVAATTGLADNDTGAPSANDVIINVMYK